MTTDQALRRLLERPGLSTRIVAAEAGSSRTTVSAMQLGRKPVAPEVLAAARRVALREIMETAEVLVATMEEARET